jgi:hypothetical protein
MDQLVKIVLAPLWTALAAGIRMLGSDVSAGRKFDAIVSRAAHALNRPQTGTHPLPPDTVADPPRQMTLLPSTRKDER